MADKPVLEKIGSYTTYEQHKHGEQDQFDHVYILVVNTPGRTRTWVRNGKINVSTLHNNCKRMTCSIPWRCFSVWRYKPNSEMGCLDFFCIKFFKNVRTGLSPWA